MKVYPRRMFAVPARWVRKVSFAHRRAVARFAVVAACAMLVAVAATSAIAAHWARDMREPRIALLGAGNHLSVLVTAGDARVLIVSGNEPAAFADALSRARPPTMRRLDVLIVGGNADV
jgi:hypothetical protein